MILIDSRIGSKHFAQLLPPGSWEIGQLEFGDFAFDGRGPEGVPWRIGIELKTVSDLLSCIASNRYTDHQLPGMMANYNVSYLIIEGMVKYDLSNGFVKRRHEGKWKATPFGQRKFYVTEVLGFLNTLTIKCDIRIWQSAAPKETAAYLLSLHRWWTHKDFDTHKSHLQSGHSVPLIGKMPFFKRVAGEFPGIGYEKLNKLENHFHGSVRTMVNATIDEWQKIEGIGKTIASKIEEAVK